MKKQLYLIVPPVAVLLCSLLLLTSLDNRIFDLFLRAIPSLTETDKVIIVTVDDKAMENVGLFPWPRDVLADAIIFLREMGARSVVFDLNHLDRSPASVDMRFMNEDLPVILNSSFTGVDEATKQVLEAIASGAVPRSEVPFYMDELLQYNQSMWNTVNDSVGHIARDIDEYFASALQMFGDAYLTLTMLSKTDLLDHSKEFDMTAFNPDWLRENTALKNITAIQDSRTPTAIGIIPTISILLQSARGAGFVNASPDADGIRRRVHLVKKFEDAYYGQLAFTPLLSVLGNPQIEISDTAIVLRGATIDNKTQDIRIPRAQDGSMLLHWPQKQFNQYNQISSWELIRNSSQEYTLLKNLTSMEDSGFLAVWGSEPAPTTLYGKAKSMKQLLKNAQAQEYDLTFDSYIELRTNFFNSVHSFLDPQYEELLLATVPEDQVTTREFVTDFFEVTRRQFTELIENRERVTGKVDDAFAIIGVDATSMTDQGMITFQERFPNVGLHAVVANMILSSDFLVDTHPGVSILIALVLSFALGLIIKRFDTRKSLIISAGTMVTSLMLLLVAFILTRRYIGVAVPFSSMTLSVLTLSTISFLDTVREKSFLRSAFSRYLSPAVINEIIADPSKLNLGGEQREMTALFTDIRGFSTIAESLNPTELVQLLNMYLTEMSNIILSNLGTIDKYEGDAIIAFFGAPISMADHATHACRTAVQMKRAEKELNRRFMAEGITPTELFTRIGINTGDMVVGNMGTPNKMDYTIMGNSVNLAARLEGVNKQYNTGGIVISEFTRSQIGEELLVRTLDRIRVVGIARPIRIFELLEIRSDASSKELELVAQWNLALEIFEKQDYVKAGRLFAQFASENPSDGVVKLYLSRCDQFTNKQPDQDWDGVFNLTQK